MHSDINSDNYRDQATMDLLRQRANEAGEAIKAYAEVAVTALVAKIDAEATERTEDGYPSEEQTRYGLAIGDQALHASILNIAEDGLHAVLDPVTEDPKAAIARVKKQGIDTAAANVVAEAERILFQAGDE